VKSRENLRALGIILLAACLLVPGLVETADAQTVNIPFQRLLLLVAGPSGDRIDPREKAVVEHLNGLRSRYDFSQLQMGTMHFDRPQEAALLKNPLGFSPQKGITVGLVELSEQGLPVRTLYKMEQVTAASLMAAQNDLLSRWSQLTGQPLPAELRPAGSVGGPSSTDSGAATTAATSSTGWTPSVGEPSQVYTFEGIQAVVFGLDDTVGGMWKSLMNAPLRSDGNDLAVREQTKALAEATLALRQASENGVIYPLSELAEVARLGRSWEAAEPQYYLPVPMRSSVQPVLGLLRQVEEIHAQGVRQPAPSPPGTSQ
jgi:hypothetical protein